MSPVFMMPPSASRSKAKPLDKNGALLLTRDAGAGGELIICEEFAHMDPRFFFDVVVPTLVTAGTTFIGITTLGKDVQGESDVNKMLGLRTEEGTSVFKVFSIDQVCDDCKRQGLYATCRHKEGQIPWWQSSSRRRHVRNIARDHLESFMRESLGINISLNLTPAFDPLSLDRLRKSTNDYNRSEYVPHIFVTVDPACGGEKSDYAIASAIYVRDEMIIVGAELINTIDFSEQLSLLVTHIQRLKRIQGLESALVIFIPESNLKYNAWHQSLGLRQSGLDGIVIMQEDHNRAGVSTSNDSKKAMALAFAEVLHRGHVRFHRDFVCVNSDITKKGYTVPQMKDEICKQLASFTRRIEHSKTNPHQEPKEFYSGKGGAGTDDMAIAIQLNVLMKQRFFRRNTAYGKYYRFDINNES